MKASPKKGSRKIINPFCKIELRNAQYNRSLKLAVPHWTRLLRISQLIFYRLRRFNPTKIRSILENIQASPQGGL